MILQALTEYYERLAEQGIVSSQDGVQQRYRMRLYWILMAKL